MDTHDSLPHQHHLPAQDPAQRQVPAHRADAPTAPDGEMAMSDLILAIVDVAERTDTGIDALDEGCALLLRAPLTGADSPIGGRLGAITAAVRRAKDDNRDLQETGGELMRRAEGLTDTSPLADVEELTAELAGTHRSWEELLVRCGELFEQIAEAYPQVAEGADLPLEWAPGPDLTDGGPGDEHDAPERDASEHRERDSAALAVLDWERSEVALLTYLRCGKRIEYRFAHAALIEEDARIVADRRALIKERGIREQLRTRDTSGPPEALSEEWRAAIEDLERRAEQAEARRTQVVQPFENEISTLSTKLESGRQRVHALLALSLGEHPENALTEPLRTATGKVERFVSQLLNIEQYYARTAALLTGARQRLRDYEGTMNPGHTAVDGEATDPEVAELEATLLVIVTKEREILAAATKAVADLDVERRLLCSENADQPRWVADFYASRDLRRIGHPIDLPRILEEVLAAGSDDGVPEGLAPSLIALLSKVGRSLPEAHRDKVARLEELRVLNAELDDAKERLRVELDERERVRAELAAELDRVSLLCVEATTEITNLTGQAQELERQHQALRADVDAHSGHLDTLSSERALLAQRLAEMAEAVAQAEAVLDEKSTSQRALAEAVRRVEETAAHDQGRLEVLRAQQDEVAAQIATAEAALARSLEQSAALKQEATEAAAREASVRADAEAARSALASVEADAEALRTRLAAAEAEAATAATAAEARRTAVALLQGEIDDLAERREELETLYRSKKQALAEREGKLAERHERAAAEAAAAEARLSAQHDQELAALAERRADLAAQREARLADIEREHAAASADIAEREQEMVRQRQHLDELVAALSDDLATERSVKEDEAREEHRRLLDELDELTEELAQERAREEADIRRRDEVLRAELRERVEALAADLKHLEQERATANGDVAAAIAAVADARRRLGDLKSSLKVISAEEEELVAQIERGISKNEEVTARLAEVEAESERLTADLNARRSSRQRLLDEAALCEADLDRILLRAQTAKQGVAEAEAAIEEARREIESLEGERAALVVDREAKIRDIEFIRGRLQVTEAELAEAEAASVNSRARIEQAQTEADAVAHSLALAETDCTELRERLEGAQREKVRLLRAIAEAQRDTGDLTVLLSDEIARREKLNDALAQMQPLSTDTEETTASPEGSRRGLRRGGR